MKNSGISVIICCFNSSAIIDETLQYLFRQKFLNNLDWEIIVVNNASIDNTVEIAKRAFTSVNNISYKIVTELKPGLIHARNRGIQAAQYEYILFCDDDNFLCNTYVQDVFNIMSSDYTIGACGGKGKSLIRGCDEPEWFKKFSSSYAVGSQTSNKGHVRQLYGAGICIRRSALEKIYKCGFVSFCTGRKGSSLLAGEDSELNFALRLSGCKLFADDVLVFQHVISPKKLTEEYLKQMHYGFGISYSVNFLYAKALNETKIKSYFALLILSVFRILKSGFFNDIEHLLLFAKSLGILKGVVYFNTSLFKILKIIKQLDRASCK